MSMSFIIWSRRQGKQTSVGDKETKKFEPVAVGDALA